MFLNIIFFATLYPVLFIIYVIFILQDAPKDGSIFAVNMQPEWLEDADIKAIRKRFKKEMHWIGLLLAVIPFSTLLIQHFSIQLTVWMLWMLAAIILLTLPQVLANIRLKNWKQDHGHYEISSTEHYVELKNAGSIRCVHFFPFFLPVTLGFLSAALCIPFYKISGESCLAGAFCGFLYLLAAILMDRQPVQVISTESAINLNYTRAKKNIWKNFWLYCIWLNTLFILFLLAISFVSKQIEMIMLISMIVYILLLIAACIPAIFKLEKIEKFYADKHDLSSSAEDDRCWIGGIFYYNPNDLRSMVDKKIGIGTTLNMASKAGKISSLITALIFLSIPVFCAWVIAEEFTPIHLEIEDNYLCAEHLRTDYTLSLDSIDDVEMITELPDWSKINGEGMDNLEKGTFQISDQGECQVFLNPQNRKFLHFSVNGTQYYMSGVDDVQTEAVYQSILGK